jgi:hypothetical protein
MAGFNHGLVYLAVALVVLGLLCLWWRRSTSGAITLTTATPTSKAADIAKLAPGTLVKVKGTVRCAKPLIAEFSQQPCVYFRSEIEREEVYYDRDSDGKERRNTRKTSLHSNIQYAPCVVEDDSGTVAVDLEGADIEAIEAVSGYGYPANSKAGAVALGTVANAFVAVASVVSEQDIRHWERVLAVDIPVYLMGEVHPGGTIGKHAKGSHNKTFVFSYKSEAERIKDLGSTMTLALWLAIILFAAAAATLVWAWNKGPV